MKGIRIISDATQVHREDHLWNCTQKMVARSRYRAIRYTVDLEKSLVGLKVRRSTDQTGATLAPSRADGLSTVRLTARELAPPSRLRTV